MFGFDVVVATSPPLTTGIPASLASALRRIPFILDVRDLWPECAVELGYLTNPNARAMAYSLERFLYRRASRIVCVSNGIRDDIVARGVHGDKCTVLTNGIDTDLFHPGARDNVVEQLREGGNTIGIYLGTLSAYHGLDHAVNLLERLEQFPHVKVVFCGGGSAENEFRTAVEARQLKNAIFMQAPSLNRMPGLVASCDFCLAFVKESAFSRWLLSAKVFMYMACARPIYAAADGETRRIIEEAGAGCVVAPNSDGIRQLAEKIATMRDETLTASYGRRGRAYVERHSSWQIIAANYERVLTQAVG
jgi:glycosyltransferase involved in cell wall biosynthesis